MMCKRKAFTLIEVIVVIGIIAIIAALLFPVFKEAKKRAYIGSCATKLRQLGEALRLYGNDHENWAPPWSTSSSMISGKPGLLGRHYNGDPAKWKAALMSYNGKTSDQFWCELDPHKGKKFLGHLEPEGSERWIHTSYMVNFTFGPNMFGTREGVFQLHLDDVASGWHLPSSMTVYISDVSWADGSAPPGVNRLIGNHDRGRSINGLYLDGHVQHAVVEKL